MKHRALINNYFLNSVYAFALFGVYALTIAPFINNFIEFGEPNAFVGIFGFAMLFAEFFALKYKLKIVRVRTQLKRIEYKKKTGIHVIPSISSGVLFGFFLRLVFQVVIIMICMTSLGYECNEQIMSPQGLVAILGGFFLEITGLVYLFVNRDIYTDIPTTKKQFWAEIKEDDDWAAANLEKELSEYSFRKEMLANIILQIFSCMIFSTFWQYINKNGIDTLINLYEDKFSAIGTFSFLFPAMLVIIIAVLRPMQIAHWIEASLQAFSRKEKTKNRVILLTVGIFACAPAIIKYLELFIFKTGDVSTTFPEYVEYIITLALFIMILAIEIRWLEKAEIPEEELIPIKDQVK